MFETGVSTTQITLEWEVEEFFSLPLDDAYWLKTDLFGFSKGEYVLVLRPNGEQVNNTAGWTCLYLIRRYSPYEDRIAYTVGVKRSDGSIFKSVEGHGLFSENKRGYGLRISPRYELRKHRKELAPNGKLTLFCTIRLNSDGVKEVSTQAALPNKISSQLNEYQNKVKELEEKLCVVKEKENIKKKIRDARDGALQTLSENLKELFSSGTQGDVTIKTKDKDITAHRGVLAARSSVFRAMLEVDMAENNDGVITIEDSDARCLESFLLFLYGGDLDVVSASNALGLYYLADKYNFPELKRACCHCLSRELSIYTVCDIARLSALHGETELLETATEFFSSNMADIISTSKWMSFLVKNTLVANELLVKAADRLKIFSKNK